MTQSMLVKPTPSFSDLTLLCTAHLSWDVISEPRDIQILPPSSVARQHQTLVGMTTQKDLSLSGVCFLVGKEQLYFHSFRITSHHRWSQHRWRLKGATLLEVSS